MRQLEIMQDIRGKAISLISLIKKEYHLENEWRKNILGQRPTEDEPGRKKIMNIEYDCAAGRYSQDLSHYVKYISGEMSCNNIDFSRYTIAQ